MNNAALIEEARNWLAGDYPANHDELEADYREGAECVAKLISALTASEAENARLRDIITSTITAIERGDLYERMCCDGRQCGCMGATNADYVLHLLREALTGGQ